MNQPTKTIHITTATVSGHSIVAAKIATKQKEDSILADANFCLDNPDVLHTPAQHREIIKGLLDIVAVRGMRL